MPYLWTLIFIAKLKDLTLDMNYFFIKTIYIVSLLKLLLCPFSGYSVTFVRKFMNVSHNVK